MIWILLAVGVIVFFVISSSKKTRLANAEAAQISEKSLAYADYLKRTAKEAPLKDMTVNELREFIVSKIRAYNKEMLDLENGTDTLFGFVVLGAIIWAMAAKEFFPLLLGLIPAIFISRYKDSSTKKVDEKYKREGLDPYRLKLDKPE